ncbi:MAG: fibronectin type III domain-containing protein [Chitinophagaceae bacterium]|nr:fibronectin type III domain-containing protein [Chitinophagaceae bacterium]
MKTVKYFFYAALYVLSVLGCKKKVIIPLPPASLTATTVSTSQITLLWTDNSTNESGFKVERKVGTGVYSVVATVSSNVNTFNDNGLTQNTTYTYRVYAYNSAGQSLTYSNEASATTNGVPLLTTTAVSSITASSAVSGGTISSDGGTQILAKGIVWSASPSPTIALASKTTDGTGTGSFTSSITGLSTNTNYYIRAYASNSNGTGYGNEVSFATNNINLSSGLIAHYPFNGNANDESGNSNNGNLVGQAILNPDRFGNANKSLRFNMGSDLVCTSIQQTNPQIFSISLWFNSSNQIQTSQFIFSFDQGQCSHNINWDRTIYLTQSSINFYTFGNGGGTLTGAGNFIDGNWHHCVVTMGNVGTKIYVDGSLLVQNSQIVSAQGYNGYWRIGGLSPNDANNSLIGKIDDVYIWNRILTQEEVLYLASH